jgi:hypothetical protein
MQYALISYDLQLILALMRSGGGPIEAPRRPRRLARGREEREQRRQLLERHARDIQELRGAGLHVGKRYTPPRDASWPGRHRTS